MLAVRKPKAEERASPPVPGADDEIIQLNIDPRK
jgi:hypothetical protein